MIIEKCNTCNLGFNHNYTPIEPIGNVATAKVFVVVYAPNVKDVENKRLVVTKYIEQLYFDLSIINFNKEDVYITFLLKCKNNIKSKTPDDLYLDKCNMHFQNELNLFKNGIIILIGHQVINYILNGKFYLIRDFGKLLSNNRFCFLNLPALKMLYNNKEQQVIYHKALVKSYLWYKNNIDFNHKSVYHVC